jgi:hypothetical protein
MITKAYILEINQQSNKYKIRIPIFEKPGLSTENSKLSNTVFQATLSHEPTANQSYRVGDCVFVGFENNQNNRPIILGKLYTVDEVENKTGALNSKSLLVYDKAVLPADTTIGNIDFGNISNFFNRINDVIDNKDLFVDSIQFTTQNEGAGLVSFDDDEGVLEVSLSPNVVLDIGIDDVIKVYNDTAGTLTYGQAVYNSGVVTSTNKFKVKLSQASNHSISDNTLGLITEPILSGQYGFVKRRGLISNVLVPPSIYSVNQRIYLAPQEVGESDGRFTNQRPVPQDCIAELGFVTKLSSDDTTPDGQIYVDIHIIPISSDISYDNTSAELSSQTVKGALDELSLGKVDVGGLSSNINLYATTTSSSISGYYKIVTDISDPAYNSSAVDVSTGVINNSRLIASLVSEPNLFVGNPGVINIATIGNIKRTVGNNNQYAAFYFEVYKRTSGGTETLLSTSNETPNLIIGNIYEEFNASALTNFGTFTATDRVVIKFLANMTGNAGSSYDFQFGGLNPVRTLLPVPVSVIPTPLASAIITDISNFNNILSSDDTNVQLALNTLNSHTHPLEIATTTTLGAIKVGSRLSITVDGTLSADAVSPVFTDAVVNNSAVEIVPLTVNALSSTTENYQEWKVNNVSQSVLGPLGFSTNSMLTVGSLTARSNYNSLTTYAVGTVVLYNNKVYISRRLTSAGINPTNANYWLEIGADIRKNVLIGSSNAASIWNTGSDLVLESQTGNLNFVGLGNVPLRIFSQVATEGGIQSSASVPFNFNVISATEQAIGAFSDYTGSAWRARGTSVGLVKFENGAWNITSNTERTIETNYTPTSRLFISSLGNIGISETNPTYKLDINAETLGSRVSIDSATADDVYGYYSDVKTQEGDSYGMSITSSAYGVDRYAYGLYVDAFAYEDSNKAYAIYSTGGQNYFNGNVGIGVTSPTAKLDVGGNVKHTGLTMTSGTNIDQLKTVLFISALTTSWTDVTGVSGTFLDGGSYIVQIISNGEYYTGIMSWYQDATTSTIVDEIMLQRAGPTASAGRIYARVTRTTSGTLKLQVSGSTSISSHSMIFKFRRII